MTPKIIEPSIRETAFNCPHCSALTTQYWYTVRAQQVEGEPAIPTMPHSDFEIDLANMTELSNEDRAEGVRWFRKIQSGQVFLEDNGQNSYTQTARNLHLSKCFNCRKFSVWIHERLVFPEGHATVSPNPDLPEEIVRDFQEARSIVNASARGAAALLRLCVQKLCKYLGESGNNI